MNNRLYTWLLAFLATVSISSCIKDRCVEGSNRTATEYRDIAGFDGISSDSDFDIFIEQNDSNFYEVSVEADDNLISYIYTEVRGSTLDISSKDRCLKTEKPIKIRVKTPVVTYLNLSGSGYMACDNINSMYPVSVVLSGSGDISMYGLNVTSIDVSVPGSGQVELVGSANVGKFKIGGSGVIEACKLDLNRCDIEIPGSGEANVYPYDLLDVYISGSGKVYYGHVPSSMYQEIPGSGDVIYDPRCR